MGAVKYPEKGCLLYINKYECIVNHQSMWWFNSETILAEKSIRKENTKEKIKLYGALSITGDTITPVKELSKEHVFNKLNQ